MRSIQLVVLTAVLTVGIAAGASAAPEQLQLKSPEKQQREQQGRSLAKNIDLSRIQDPAAREAIGAIMTALNLEVKKQSHVKEYAL